MNPHGCGFVSKTNHFKSLDFNMFLRHLHNVPQDENCIIHFRYATNGSVCKANYHPFTHKSISFAHNGILNIMGEYERKYGSWPDAVISGFHLMKKSDYTDDEIDEIIDTAQRLKEYRTTFYTCHCTGVKAYESMKCIMGDQLKYVHSGEEVRLKFHKSAEEKRRKQFMRCE